MNRMPFGLSRPCDFCNMWWEFSMCSMMLIAVIKSKKYQIIVVISCKSPSIKVHILSCFIDSLTLESIRTPLVILCRKRNSNFASQPQPISSILKAVQVLPIRLIEKASSNILLENLYCSVSAKLKYY